MFLLIIFDSINDSNRDIVIKVDVNI
jgi:hypothetical protein